MQFEHGQLVCVPGAPPDPPEPAEHAPQSFAHVEQVSSPSHVPSPHRGSSDSGAETAGEVSDSVADARLGAAASGEDLSSDGRLLVTGDGRLSALAHADTRHAATIDIACCASVAIT
jgi:hypothetical protein